jgi:hypothetical protein
MDLLSQDTWRFINTFSPWLAALGTIAAVLVSLHLARRDKKIRLEVSAGHRIIITSGVPAPYPEYLYIHIVNIGHREAQITNIGWKAGFLRKRHAVQATVHEMSSPIPVRLKDGEEAQYFISLNEERNWLKDFVQRMLQPYPQLQSYFLKVQVFTSIGNKFEARIEKSLRDKLIKATTKDI